MIPPGTGSRAEASTAARRPAHSSVPVLIVGGGIAGCSLAYALSLRGIANLLVEKGQVGAEGASAVGAALLNPYRGRSGKPGQFDLDGLQAFWQLDGQLRERGWNSGAHRSGVLRVASSARQARAWQALPGMVRQPHPPRPYRAPEGAFLVSQGGWAEPRLLLSALIGAAGEMGSEIREHCEVDRLERRGDDWLVHSDRGSVRARTVVLCLGAGTVAGTPLPRLQRIAGDQVTLASTEHLPYPIAGAVYLASTGTRVLVGGNHRDPAASDPEGPRLLRASAARMVPPLTDAAIEGVWTGVRAKTGDNVPLVNELEAGLWFLGAFGGRGFLTAPLLSSRLAETLARELPG